MVDNLIHSSGAAAKQIATKMGNASQAIMSATNKAMITDDKTTLVVNEQAQVAHQEAIKLAQAFNASFLKTVEDLQSVAREFERTDQELTSAINDMLFSMKFMEDLMTYTKAKNG